MSGALHGDPASCSQTGGSQRRLASRLEAAGATVTSAASEAEDAWSGRVARAVTQRRRLLLETTQGTVRALDRIGSLLQDHATDLADALQEQRSVESRAQAQGLRVVDGRVELAWGVAGLADPSGAATREASREQLQAELDLAALHLARRRARLADALDAARRDLAEHSAALRG